MDKITIQTLIDKVIGKKGLIRVPSWWMRKVLMQIADWVQEGDDANGEKIVKVKEEADANDVKIKEEINEKISTLETNVSTFKTDTDNILFELVRVSNSSIPIKYFTVKTESKSGFITVDGVKQSIPVNTKRIISFVNEFRVGSSSPPPNEISFVGFGLIDTSAMTDMSYMFSRCYKLTSLNLLGFDTSAVTDMRNMFNFCYGLATLDLSSFNTSAVTNMQSMFESCRGLTSLNLTGFDTSAVTNMGVMFNDCESLTSLNLSSFDTSAVTIMSKIFSNCPAITSLILGPNFFKTPNVTSVDFSYCTKWTNDTVVTSLVTNSYDRATAGLKTMTLQLSANTKAALTDEQKAAITAKGYTIA